MQATSAAAAMAVTVGSPIAIMPLATLTQEPDMRPVTLVVPIAAGGGVDTIARVVAGLKQPWVVENRPGAGGPSVSIRSPRPHPTATRWHPGALTRARRRRSMT